jgi:hypothetical protein
MQHGRPASSLRIGLTDLGNGEHHFLTNTESAMFERTPQLAAILVGLVEGEIRKGDVEGFVESGEECDRVTTILVDIDDDDGS